MADHTQAARLPTAGWRLKLGATLFILSVIGPIAVVPLVALMDLSTALAATITGVVLAGGEVLGLAAVAVMGKSGYNYIKARVFALFKRYGPPQRVGRRRYMVGLVLFLIPILFGWIAPYAGSLIPGYDENEIAFAIGGDLLLLTSLFVLGGDFWDKLGALFVHGAEVVFPTSPPTEAEMPNG